MVHGERFNAITHLVGSALAIAGTAALIVAATTAGGAQRITAAATYGAMLVLLYVSSTLYHTVHGPAKKLFHVFDHCAIYLLIAGTYTPFTLIALHGFWRWTLFGTIWFLALAGVAKDIFFHSRFRALSVVLYVVMGWLVVIAFAPLQRAVAPAGVAWLIASGIIYTVGIAFYATSKHITFAHGVWHLFVLTASICHYIAVLRYVVPLNANA
jgi:hemolysin III